VCRKLISGRKNYIDHYHSKQFFKNKIKRAVQNYLKEKKDFLVILRSFVDFLQEEPIEQ